MSAGYLSAAPAYPRPPSVFVSEELETFRRGVARFVAQEIRPHAERWEQAGEIDRALYRRAAELGYFGLRYEPAYGGGGADFLATTVLCEELAKGDSIGTAVALMAHSEFALSVMAAEASHEIKSEFLVPALEGEKIGSIGVSEPGAGSDVAAIQCRAEREGGDFLISGQKTFISNGPRADFISLAVRTGEGGSGGISLIAFPTDTPGFTVGRRMEKLGSRASDTGELFFDRCRVPTRNLIGEEGQGMKYILAHFAGERLVIAAFAVGAMERLIELGMAHATARSAFKTRLRDFQTWRHRFAEMATKLEATRLLAHQAAHLLARRSAHGEMAVSMAKLHAAAAVQNVAAEILQLHGGFGQMEESPVPRYYRDVAGFSVGAGTSEIMREIVSRTLVRNMEG